MRRFIYCFGSTVVVGGMVIAPLCFAAGGGGGGAGGGAAGGGAAATAGGGANAAASGATAGSQGAGQGGANGANVGGGAGNPGAGNPLGASPGGSNPLGSTSPGTSPLGSGPGGSNPLGTTQTPTQGANPSTADPNSSINNPSNSNSNLNSNQNQNNQRSTNVGDSSSDASRLGSGIGTERQNGATGSGVGLPDSTGNGAPSKIQTHVGDEHQMSENNSRSNSLRNRANSNAQNNGQTNDQTGSNLSGTNQTTMDRTGNGPQDWRQVYYDNHWWYYTPSNNWMYYDQSRWNAYRAPGNSSSQANATGGAVGTNGADNNGQYGVGYRGDANVNGNAQDRASVDNGRNFSRGRAANQNSLSGGTARTSQRSIPAARPNAPTESELRAYEQQNFGNSGTGINSANDRTKTGQSLNGAGPAMGVDSNGIPIQSGQPQNP
jgi:hypothetical protein